MARPNTQILEPGIRLVLAPNPSPMTYLGTNTYIVGTGSVAVIDPGPNLPDHQDAILGALNAGEQVSHIFVTHSHLDHSPLARPLAKATGAPIFAFGPTGAGRSTTMAELADVAGIGGGEGIDVDFRPDVELIDQQTIHGANWSLTALHSPGHMSNHMCFCWNDVVFSGDHVMAWASTLISPPDGDLGAFMGSCRKLAKRTGDRVYYPGHGEPIFDPTERLAWLINHRNKREVDILNALKQGARTIPNLTEEIYHDVDPKMHAAAGRNILAHLIDLWERELVLAVPNLSQDATFRLI